MTTQLVIMTPSLAKTILNASPQIARPVSERRVALMAHHMQHPDNKEPERMWPIVIDRNGHLADGRHILLAVIQAGTEVRVRLEDNSDPNPFTKYDDA